MFRLISVGAPTPLHSQPADRLALYHDPYMDARLQICLCTCGCDVICKERVVWIGVTN